MSEETYLVEMALRVLREGTGWFESEGVRLTESEWARLARIIAEFEQEP